MVKTKTKRFSNDFMIDKAQKRKKNRKCVYIIQNHYECAKTQNRQKNKDESIFIKLKKMTVHKRKIDVRTKKKQTKSFSLESHKSKKSKG